MWGNVPQIYTSFQLAIWTRRLNQRIWRKSRLQEGPWRKWDGDTTSLWGWGGVPGAPEHVQSCLMNTGWWFLFTDGIAKQFICRFHLEHCLPKDSDQLPEVQSQWFRLLVPSYLPERSAWVQRDPCGGHSAQDIVWLLPENVSVLRRMEMNSHLKPAPAYQANKGNNRLLAQK